MEEQRVESGGANRMVRLMDKGYGRDSLTTTIRGTTLILAGVLLATLAGFSDSSAVHRIFGTLGKLLYGPGSLFIVAGLFRAILAESHQQWLKVFMMISVTLFLVYGVFNVLL